MMLNIRLLVKIKSKVKLSVTCYQTTNCVFHIFCKKMSTGMLRVGSSRRSKAKSPYAIPPAPLATPLVPRLQQTRGSTHVDSATSGNDLLPVCTSGLQEPRPSNFSDVQSQQPSRTPVAPNLPDAQPQLQDVFSPMSQKRKMWHISQVCM